MPNLWRAWQEFARGKRPSQDMALFRLHLEVELQKLQYEFDTNSYRHGSYRQFVVHDPKRREIAAAPVRDRVVHRLLYHYLLQMWDDSFMYDAWSCRPGKGLLGAIMRTQQQAHRYRHGWVWRSDIRRFFDSVNHARLHYCLQTRLDTNARVYSLLDEVIGSYRISQAGMPIGNLTSQIFANIYLNEFDQFVLHSLKPLGYVRYGDDFVLWCQDEVAVREAQCVGGQFLADYLHLTVNPKHDTVQPTAHRLDYLGVQLWPSGRRLAPTMQQRIERKLTLDNVDSYEALIQHHMPKRYHQRWQWQKLDIIDDV